MFARHSKLFGHRLTSPRSIVEPGSCSKEREVHVHRTRAADREASPNHHSVCNQGRTYSGQCRTHGTKEDSKTNDNIGYSNKDKIAQIPELSVDALTTRPILYGICSERSLGMLNYSEPRSEGFT